MKKLFTLLFLATSMICFGQNKNFLKEVESINFYGVDYSAAKVFGAAETPAQFKVAFDGINRLFITEAKKYDVSKNGNVPVFRRSCTRIMAILIILRRRSLNRGIHGDTLAKLSCHKITR